ncbi:MAG: GtrA family protein [Chloroflexi bacterium]|nr:GtrA family protein [Chloroflexota bacterium]
MTIVRRIRLYFHENPKELKRFGKFAVVGTIGALVDFSILNFGIQVLLLPKWLANTFSFFAAVLSNFIWNRFWTYPETRQMPLLPQLGQFLLVNLAGYGINQLVFLSLDHYVFSSWGSWSYNISKALAIGVVLFWNFFINRIWTYGKVK